VEDYAGFRVLVDERRRMSFSLPKQCIIREEREREVEEKGFTDAAITMTFKYYSYKDLPTKDQVTSSFSLLYKNDLYLNQ